jgi:hypothetical protein
MVQKRRERTLRGGLGAPAPEASTAFGPLGSSTSHPTGRRGRDRVIALGAVATLATVAGIAGWRLIDADPDGGWASQTQAQIGSLDQQLTLLAQTTRQWQNQPPALVARRPDVAALLLQREQELTREKADLAVELARYQQLPALRAREAAANAQAQALTRRLDAPSVAADPDAHAQLMTQLAAVREQRERDALAARTAADAVAAAKTDELPDDSAKTRGVLAVVTSLINRPAPPAPAVPPGVQVEAAGPPTPDLAPGAFAVAGGQPAAIPDAPAPAIPPPSPAATAPNAPAGMPIAPAPHRPIPAPLSPPSPGLARALPPTARIGAHDNDNARDNADRDNAAPAGASSPSSSRPHVVGQGAGTAPAPVAKDDRAPADERPFPALEQRPSAADPVPAAQQQTPVEEQPAPRIEQPAPAQRVSQQQRPEAAEPRAQAPQPEYREQPRAESTASRLPSEAEVKEYSGSSKIARDSQTPEGQALMRSMFGEEDDSDGSTATDRASVRRDATPDSATGADRRKSHKSRSSADSAPKQESGGHNDSSTAESSGHSESTPNSSESASDSSGSTRDVGDEESAVKTGSSGGSTKGSKKGSKKDSEDTSEDSDSSEGSDD